MTAATEAATRAGLTARVASSQEHGATVLIAARPTARD